MVCLSVRKLVLYMSTGLWGRVASASVSPTLSTSGWLFSSFVICFFFSSRRRHTRCLSDWSSDVCSSDLAILARCELDWAGANRKVARAAAAGADEQRIHRRGREYLSARFCRLHPLSF